jgi:uncharacterized CHY-type Zn-finger protein
MVHSIGTYTLECINCKTTKAIDATLHKPNKKLVDSYRFSTTNPIQKSVDCPGCGADVEFKEFEVSKCCPYCKSPLVTQTTNTLPPNAILPFVVNKDEAKDIFKKWIGSLWFAPNSLSKLLDFEHQFEAVYIPYFSFDAATYSNYSGARGDAYYVEVVREVYVNGRAQRVTQMERRVRWSDVRGSVARDFQDILIVAKSNLPDIIQKIYSYDLNMLVDYNPSFLSGYKSSEYNIEMQECYSSAKEYMKSIIYRDVLWDIGGDEQRVYSIDSNFDNEVFEVTMLPIWMSSFDYNGKKYSITINGVNGEIAGERPYSYVKIFALIFAIMVLIAGVFYLDQNYDIFDRGVNFETNYNQGRYLP